MDMVIRDITFADRPWVGAFLREQFGSTRVVSRGVLHQADELPGFIARCGGQPAGLLTYHVAGGALEVVTLHAARPGLGLGTALLDAVQARARSLGCARLWLITTNDNEPAARFYERRGMTRVAVHRDAVTEARTIKPEIPETGIDGVPIRDEIEYELQL
jgi:ribosomal protein S18 acetylase RimI-like enzyme